MNKSDKTHQQKLAAKRKKRAKEVHNQKAATKSNKRTELEEKDPQQMLTVEGVAISSQLMGVRNGRFFKSEGQWFLCSKKKQIIAAFSTLEELQAWWHKFQVSQQRVSHELLPINAKSKKKRKRKLIEQVQGRASANRPQGQSSPCANNPKADRVVWNSKYDMPEF